MKYILSAVTLIAIFSLYACKSGECTSDENTMNKLDAQSQLELTRAEQANSDKMISIVMMFEEEPTESIIEEMKEMKVKIITKVGKIVTAQANTESIKKIIKCKAIKQIEINKRKTTK